MHSAYFTITPAHRTAFGHLTVPSLRSIDSTTQQRQWANELADQLEAASFATLGDAPAAWGWMIRLPDDAAPPTEGWRTKAGTFTVPILRNAREALQLDYSHRFAARNADLADALERDGFTRLDETPKDWNWVPGGR
jgi:hypothetical protein